MAPYYPFSPPDALTTEEGHYATVKAVAKKGGRHEGKWLLRITHPGGEKKTLYADATPSAVREKMAKYLGLPLSSITMYFGDPKSAKPPVSLSTDYGHSGTVSLVERNSKRMWELNLKGPTVLFDSPSCDAWVSAIVDPSEQDAALIASNFFGVSPEEIKFRYRDENADDHPAAPSVTPTRAPPTTKPLDKFEFSPNGRATCHGCHERITERSQRVGIQKWKEAYKHWQTVYYHRDCCTNDMLESLNLGSDCGKRKRQDDSSATAATTTATSATGSRIESKLQAELDRQEEQSRSKRRLVYGIRGDLRDELRRVRMELANQLEMEPYKIFDNDTLDDIVAKVPSNERELLKCRGIAQRRCDRYGGAILQVISQHQMAHQDT